MCRIRCAKSTKFALSLLSLTSLKEHPGMDYQTLKTRHRIERDAHHPNLALRVHRALSWLNRAEQAEDVDGRFFFLWISFNGAYATDIDEQYRLSEQESFKVAKALHAGHREPD